MCSSSRNAGLVIRIQCLLTVSVSATARLFRSGVWTHLVKSVLNLDQEKKRMRPRRPTDRLDRFRSERGRGRLKTQEPNTGKRAFSFLELNQRQQKPRCAGLTEIRGPYYTVMGKRYLADLLETMGEYVD